MSTHAASWPKLPKRIMIGKVPVSHIGSVDVCSVLDDLVHDNAPHYVCFCESNLWVCAMRDEAVLAALHKASVVLPDGVSMTMGCRLYGTRLEQRTPGPTVLLKYCRHGVNEGLRHFFCGGAEGVARRLATRLCSEIPGLQVVGVYSPPYRNMTDAEEREFRELIMTSKPHVVWVGLGAPKQELWMAKRLDSLNVPLMLGVGAAFDFHSGNRRWAPAWIRELGLEWAFRTLTGGRATLVRNFKCVPQFAWMIALHSIKARWL